MKKVLVIGRPDRLEAFKSLSLSNCEITYFDQIHFDMQKMEQELEGMMGTRMEDFAHMLQNQESDELEDEFAGSAEPETSEDDLDALDEDDADQKYEFEDMDELGPHMEEEASLGGSDAGVLLNLEQYQIVFDLNLDENPENIERYAAHPHLWVFGNAVLKSLISIENEYLGDVECRLSGINAWPTFLDRPVTEISLRFPGQKDEVAALLSELGLKPEFVEDRVGMVSPRVISMIINEACFMAGEGTAGLKEIDTAMKLGTNYPKGPFEWADKIGVSAVYFLIEALWNDTHDSKYKIAPLLVKHGSESRPFYVS